MTTEAIAPEKKPKTAPKAKKPRDPSAPAKKAGPKRTAEERADALIERAEVRAEALRARARTIRARKTEKRRKAFEKAMAAASAAFARAAKIVDPSAPSTAALCMELASETDKLAGTPWGEPTHTNLS